MLFRSDPALIQASKPKKVVELKEEPVQRRKGESAPLQVLVNGQDLARVRAAELVLLDEEAREGRFARNHNGQLVPAAQVEDEEHHVPWRPMRVPPASGTRIRILGTRRAKLKGGGRSGPWRTTRRRTR